MGGLGMMLGGQGGMHGNQPYDSDITKVWQQSIDKQ